MTFYFVFSIRLLSLLCLLEVIIICCLPLRLSYLYIIIISSSSNNNNNNNNLLFTFKDFIFKELLFLLQLLLCFSYGCL